MKLIIPVLLLSIPIGIARSQNEPLLINDSTFTKTDFEEAKIDNKDASVFFTTFPYNSAAEGFDGNVFVSFIIRKDGQLDSIQFLNKPGELFKDTALDALHKSIGHWNPCNFDGVPFDKKYIAGFNFTHSHSFFYKKDKSLKYLRKGQSDRALKFINQAIKINPFDSELYQFRARIYRKQNKKELEISDLATIDKLNSSMLFNIWF